MKRCTAQARATITSAVKRIAASAGRCQPKWWMSVPKIALIRWAKGTCPSMMPTRVSAAKSASTPWL